MLYVLCREWRADREIRAALGVENPDQLDEDLGLTGSPPAGGTDGRDSRRAQVIAMGGELG